MSRTTIHLYEEDLRRLDDAAEQLFSTTEVPRRVTINRLLRDHDDVDYDGDE